MSNKKINNIKESLEYLKKNKTVSTKQLFDDIETETIYDLKAMGYIGFGKNKH